MSYTEVCIMRDAIFEDEISEQKAIKKLNKLVKVYFYEKRYSQKLLDQFIDFFSGMDYKSVSEKRIVNNLLKKWMKKMIEKVQGKKFKKTTISTLTHKGNKISVVDEGSDSESDNSDSSDSDSDSDSDSESDNSDSSDSDDSESDNSDSSESDSESNNKSKRRKTSCK